MVLSLPRNNAGRRTAQRMEPCGNPWNRHFLALDTGQKLLRHKAIVVCGIYARLVSDGSSDLERTGRTLPPPRQTRRPLHSEKTAGSRGRIRRPNSAAQAEAICGITHFEEWGAVTGSGNDGGFDFSLVAQARPARSCAGHPRLCLLQASNISMVGDETRP
jgi:hypothetical protein